MLSVGLSRWLVPRYDPRMSPIRDIKAMVREVTGKLDPIVHTIGPSSKPVLASARALLAISDGTGRDELLQAVKWSTEAGAKIRNAEPVLGQSIEELNSYASRI